MVLHPLHACSVLASPWPGVHATDIASARHYAPHWHATFGLGVMDAGAHRSSSGRGAVEAFAGDVVATNPGEVHDGRPLGGHPRRWRTVYLEPEVVAAIAAEEGCALPAAVEFAQPALSDPLVLGAVQGLLAVLQGWTRGDAACTALACEQAVVRACALMLRRHGSQRSAAPAAPVGLQRVLERLAEDAGGAPTLSELAALAGGSRFQLLRSFRQVCGITPHAWWLQHRAERARTLIAQGVPIAEAAGVAGFADQSHLHRVFTRRFGYTPGAWRRAVAQ